ncbi:MAG: metallophosphoesterase family protein [Candidatus Aenigmarchaeota archaeon]|nr:metallophosphoesterase family protein [Candidatus Aenigmarchaeota archaeon]
MKKEELVRLFFTRQKLISPEALSYLEGFSDKEVTNILERDLDLIVLKNHITFLKRYEIVKNLTKKETCNQIEYLNSKFNKMKDILASRIDKKFISINKITQTREDIYIIGMVKDIKEGEKTLVEVEDQTGSVTISFDDPVKCDLDDVVLVQTIPSGKILYGKKIIYPDVPLREPVRGNGKGCFISDLHLNESPESDIEKFFQWFNQENINYLFIAGDVVDLEKLEKYCDNKLVFIIPGEKDVEDDYPQLPLNPKKENIISLSNPSIINIGGINILMIHDFDLSMLKKRHLGDCLLKEDFLALDIVPDIVHYGHDHKPFVNNYKSITVVNSGSLLNEFKPVVVDFSTREWKQVNI